MACFISDKFILYKYTSRHLALFRGRASLERRVYTLPLRSTCMKAIAMLFFLALIATAQNIPAGPDDIAGVVTSSKGPEAGVWVIAETTGLPTKFAKIVVTDDRGRYLLPGLPKASYSVWVRGYGLVDSPKVQSGVGKALNLKAVIAPDARAAAEY